ncbi:Mitochondrial 2-oxoadipate and 2-oxoglutarate transporter [Bulinus truncatus]|nr:Mitochondrial 2-oxoadipate and 2-oxoglutarate transporter [Bulinus truncatus]
MEGHHVPQFIQSIHDVSEDVKDKPIADLVKETVSWLHSVGKEDTPFFIVNIHDIEEKLNVWKKLLPRVELFYAVKCNNDPKVIKFLAKAGTGFDCASQAEIQQILQLGVSPSKIVYANPCKFNSHIEYAAKNNVDLITLDDERELEKIHKLFPDARLLIRIKTNDKYKVKQSFNKKYGCDMKTAEQLLYKAKSMNMKVVGVSFHVKCTREDCSFFPMVISDANELFRLGAEVGHPMNILDLGGGFPGAENDKETFEDMAKIIMAALDKYFPESRCVRIIAEPGRYVVTSALTLAVKIVAKKIIDADKYDNETNTVECCEAQNVKVNTTSNSSAADSSVYMYYLNDGIYGAFGNILIDHASVQPNYLLDSDTASTHQSIIWGPTCDSIDCVMTECLLPEMFIGQWLYFKDMGAYTTTVMCDFNGIPRPLLFYICDVQTWNDISSDARLAVN